MHHLKHSRVQVLVLLNCTITKFFSLVGGRTSASGESERCQIPRSFCRNLYIVLTMKETSLCVVFSRNGSITAGNGSIAGVLRGGCSVTGPMNL